MRAIPRQVVPFVLVFVLASDSFAVHAQCGPGKIRLEDAIELHLLSKPLVDPNGQSAAPSKAAEKIVEEQSFLKAVAEAPLAVAPATQLEAAASAAAGSAVTLPGLASLLGLAQEQGLVNSKDGITTVSLSLFSFLALLQPRYSYDQELYQNTQGLRRWGGSVSFGGKGESFDRNGDGKPEEALTAQDFNDIVTWEVKYQFGSRDRRDRANFEKYDSAIQAKNIPVETNTLLGQVALAARSALEAAGKFPPDGCPAASDVEAAFKSGPVLSLLSALKEVDTKQKAIAEGIFGSIDRSPIFSLVFGGTERGESFGPNKHLAALRGAFTLLGGTNALDLSWSEVENLLGTKNAVTWKLGWQYSRLLFKGTPLSKDGVTLALAGSYEKLQDVPMATHDTIAKLNAKWSIPVTEGVSIPISVTWANHKDLLTDEHEVQGHIGFTVDYKTVRDQVLGRKNKSASPKTSA